MDPSRFLKTYFLKVINTSLSPLHYRQALAVLRALEAECQAKNGDLFEVPFKYRGAGTYDKISPSQIAQEVRELYDVVRALNPRYVCEIGTDKGGTFYLWCKAAADDAVLVSVDLPSRYYYSPARRKLYACFRKTDRQSLHFIAADSHQQTTVEAVCQAIGGRFLDFLFIDGDHTYEGVRQDFEMYAPLMCSNGLIAFHDIRTEREGCGMPQFWEEIKQSYPDYREIAYGVRGPLGAGIGLIFRHD